MSLTRQEWERRASWTVQAIWGPVAPQMISPPAPAWGPPGMAPGGFGPR